ncbi:MAG: antibiotic biosynthesis monooxygenase [Bacteroidota bacterium]
MRISYRGQVALENPELFTTPWKRTTTTIHKAVKGAEGGCMLQRNEDPSALTTIAGGDSIADRKHFWQNSNPKQRLAMRDLGARIVIEVFNEIDAFTH